MGKKKLTDNDFWAQHIIRAQQNGKDYIFALVRRKYSEDDIETTGPGEYIGLEREERYPMITDNDPDSETFTKRIENKSASPIGVKMIYTDEFTPENIKKYKNMMGVTGFGTTELIYKFKQQNISVVNETEFWTESQDKLYKKHILKEQVIAIETDKPNSRRKNP